MSAVAITSSPSTLPHSSPIWLVGATSAQGEVHDAGGAVSPRSLPAGDRKQYGVEFPLGRGQAGSQGFLIDCKTLMLAGLLRENRRRGKLARNV